MRVDTVVQGTVVVATNCKCYEALPRSYRVLFQHFLKIFFIISPYFILTLNNFLLSLYLY
jgi:hypothetical protein